MIFFLKILITRRALQRGCVSRDRNNPLDCMEDIESYANHRFRQRQQLELMDVCFISYPNTEMFIEKRDRKIFFNQL